MINPSFGFGFIFMPSPQRCVLFVLATTSLIPIDLKRITVGLLSKEVHAVCHSGAPKGKSDKYFLCLAINAKIFKGGGSSGPLPPF